MTHTQGILRVDNIGDDESEIYADTGGLTAEIICHLGNFSNDNARADARRIAACWNALQGFSTEAIEAGAVHDALDTMRKLRDDLAEVDSELHAQRIAVLDITLSQLAEASNG